MKQGWLWKTIPTLTICVFVWINFDLKPNDPIPFMGVSLDYKPGVKAAIFALTSAALFIVSWIQTNPTILGRAANWLNRLASGITALLTGWYWLASEARETSEEHLGFALILTAIILSGVVVIIPLAYLGSVLFREPLQELTNWLRRKSE